MLRFTVNQRFWNAFSEYFIEGYFFMLRIFYGWNPRVPLMSVSVDPVNARTYIFNIRFLFEMAT